MYSIEFDDEAWDSFATAIDKLAGYVVETADGRTYMIVGMNEDNSRILVRKFDPTHGAIGDVFSVYTTKVKVV